jgi:MarR family transcriptional regulator, negative regulator of the multidrug operon emrRAB
MPETTANLVGALALGLTDLIRAAVDGIAGHAGETSAALVTVAAEPGLGVTALSRALGLSQPGAVRLVDRLVADGLVIRQPGKDGRAVALALTPAGEARVEALKTARLAAIDTVLSGLDADDRTALDRIARNILETMTTDRLKAFGLCRLCDWETCFAKGCPVERKFRALAKPVA